MGKKATLRPQHPSPSKPEYTGDDPALIDDPTLAGISRREVLERATQCVTQDRQKTHGPPEDTFRMIAELWSTFLVYRPKRDNPDELFIRPHEVALMLSLLKTARAAQNAGHTDNWVDIAGYAACGAELTNACY